MSGTMSTYESGPAQRELPGPWPNLDERSDMAQGTCSVDGCDRGVDSRGWCNRHYQRWYQYGDPTAHNERRAYRDPIETIDARTVVDAASGCWLWTGPRQRDGYAQVNRDGHPYVHRWVYSWLVGEIPAGMELDHLCRVRHCVNPDHLEPVTQAENIARRPKEVLGTHERNKTHCPQGHPYDVVNTRRYRGTRRCIACQKAWNRGRRKASDAALTASVESTEEMVGDLHAGKAPKVGT